VNGVARLRCSLQLLGLSEARVTYSGVRRANIAAAAAAAM